MIDKYLMNSKVAQKDKRENNYSNINHVYKMLKGNLMSITEVRKLDGTTKLFHN